MAHWLPSSLVVVVVVAQVEVQPVLQDPLNPLLAVHASKNPLPACMPKPLSELALEVMELGMAQSWVKRLAIPWAGHHSYPLQRLMVHDTIWLVHVTGIQVKVSVSSSHY